MFILKIYWRDPPDRRAGCLFRVNPGGSAGAAGATDGGVRQQPGRRQAETLRDRAAVRLQEEEKVYELVRETPPPLKSLLCLLLTSCPCFYGVLFR